MSGYYFIDQIKESVGVEEYVLPFFTTSDWDSLIQCVNPKPKLPPRPLKDTFSMIYQNKFKRTSLRRHSSQSIDPIKNSIVNQQPISNKTKNNQLDQQKQKQTESDSNFRGWDQLNELEISLAQNILLNNPKNNHYHNQTQILSPQSKPQMILEQFKK
ncbi:hypothetical protein M0812_15807 [Anaeramoeba flamelloides]|uniref:Uncharacterized protein n=1 Tax=Anaeramoeba flamelloides TaxID=1746091 RepID=A0AAV7ZDG2_9EUKA|nr:hypothetical protein M0812_15807 [Anaeramoeba flamelloides]